MWNFYYILYYLVAAVKLKEKGRSYKSEECKSGLAGES